MSVTLVRDSGDDMTGEIYINRMSDKLICQRVLITSSYTSWLLFLGYAQKRKCTQRKLRDLHHLRECITSHCSDVNSNADLIPHKIHLNFAKRTHLCMMETVLNEMLFMSWIKLCSKLKAFRNVSRLCAHPVYI